MMRYGCLILVYGCFYENVRVLEIWCMGVSCQRCTGVGFSCLCSSTTDTIKRDVTELS